MQKGKELYRGKAKTVFLTDNPSLLVLEFRNDTSAFDGEKIEQLDRKGEVNNKFNHFIMQQLEAAGVKTQVQSLMSDTESVVKKLDMIPVECVIRNFAAGSLCRRLGVEEGIALSPPTFEFFLKNDALHDPMVNESHITGFNWATEAQIAQMKAISFEVNNVLSPLFAKGGMLLVDFKLEFGIDANNDLILGDEFTPDGCRLWDSETRKKLDKDRFRQGLGSVVESYIEVAQRIGLSL
ncbi:phosphoribosylaminoimidazolesuccinocarboxamide synthase [Glaciecola sp. XM2]|jgi:phosphoribosylaminoimidazole-succinocarboxamide synthase|uniref:phosphoribosylaminoimidazolesuccinocarboxamide synthase n=1 Tax=Glaciecola sp. XM2 TaxID=1914931 RepID=UPI001BDE0E63|nr:phosphoribosylaminoimidazolesuccinocarboxamide synthase [Glaciecola sp. XM2]MBT1449595.1 phosphoribosylaminoimidazolesuccinocarboxamide synthase [Glaciecola sp. XM2]